MSNSRPTIEKERCHPAEFVRPMTQKLQDAADAFEQHVQERTRDISFRDSLFEAWKKQRIAAGRPIKIEEGLVNGTEPRLEGINEYLETSKSHVEAVKFPQIGIAEWTKHNPRITERNPFVPKQATLVRDTILVDRDGIIFLVFFRDGLNEVTRGASNRQMEDIASSVDATYEASPKAKHAVQRL
ncbi:hypothetical protein DL98DRAFT_618914 [Cadophora sp. DSE1049]|nr:hypothetical protein DL98DRAFT_618914 [Cadophora sp. DSE1049]